MLLSLFLLLPTALGQATVEVVSVEAPSTVVVVGTTITEYYTTTPSPTPLSTQYTDDLTFRTSLLNITNLYRYEHSAPYLYWNESLADYAQNYSEQCEWVHSYGGPGENLARGYSNVTAAVMAWGDERDMYSFSGDQTGFTEETGHFTQLVWKSTTSVGCGWTDCDGRNGLDGVYLVCEYWPAGNVVGQNNFYFRQNIEGERSDGSDGFNQMAATQGATGGTPAATSGQSPEATGTSEAGAGLLAKGDTSRMWSAVLVTIGALIFGFGMS